MKIAVLIEEGVDHATLAALRKGAEESEAELVLVAPHGERVRSWADGDWGPAEHVDRSLFETDAAAYDALVLPGGLQSADALRREPRVVVFVRDFVTGGRLVASCGHGAWSVIDAGGALGKPLTGAASLKIDCINAGADWTDDPLVESENLISARGAEEAPAFCASLLKRLAEKLKDAH